MVPERLSRAVHLLKTPQKSVTFEQFSNKRSGVEVKEVQYAKAPSKDAAEEQFAKSPSGSSVNLVQP